MTAAPFIPDPSAKSSLKISLILTSLLGSVLIASHWIGHGRPIDAIVRTFVFAGAMLVIHVAGYRLYRQQPIAWSPHFIPACRYALLQQVLALCFASILLDGGAMFRACAMGA